MKRKKSLEPLFAVLPAVLVACGMGAGREAPRPSNAQTPARVPTAASLNVTIAGMIDLGLADVRDINSAGEIVGAIKVGGYSHAALVVGGKVYDLGTIDDSGTTPASSSGSAINGVGQVVGHGAVGTEEYNFVWTPDVPNGTTGRMRRLPPSPDGLVAYALNINDAGQVVGHTDASSLLWTGDQVVQLINFSAFGDREVINNFGQVAGTAWNYTAEGYDWRAFLWTPDVPNGTSGTLVDLIGPNSSAYGINDRGQVVGSWPAFVWSPSSPNTSSGTLVMLDGMEQCLDINNQGQIAGALLSGYGGSHAALWTPDEPNGATGTVTDLGPPGALSPIGQARALSAGSNGEIRIVGAVQGNGAVYELGPSFLWTVMTHPSPSTQGPVARPKETTGSEGSAVAFDGTMSTGNPLPLTFSWIFGDGTTGSGPTPSHAYADNGTYTLALVVTDANGIASASATTTVTIYNVAPVGTLIATPSQLAEGQSIAVALQSVQDVAADLASLQFAFDCGNGLGYGALGSASSAVCATVDDGSRTVRGKVKDKDGGVTEYAASIPILNAPPEVSIVSAPTSVRVGASFTIRFRFTDPGTKDAPWQHRIDWGDGKTPTGPVAVSAQGGTIAETYRYAGSGQTARTVRTVTVKVTDKDGGLGTASTRIVVTR